MKKRSSLHWKRKKLPIMRLLSLLLVLGILSSVPMSALAQGDEKIYNINSTSVVISAVDEMQANVQAMVKSTKSSSQSEVALKAQSLDDTPLFAEQEPEVSSPELPLDGASFGDEVSSDEIIRTESNGSEDPSEPEGDSSSEVEEEDPLDPDSFTVTYDFGYFGLKTERVKKGEVPKNIPLFNEEAYHFVGWFNQADESVNPAEAVIEADTTFYGKVSRSVTDILITDKHIAYMLGNADGFFMPSKSLTKAESAVLFYSLLQKKDWDEKSFPDVKSKQWYTKAVGMLGTLGIVSGDDYGNFIPSKNITRAEFVRMVVSFDSVEEGKSTFSDVTERHWAKSYIMTAQKKGWISGRGNNLFYPDATITRAEAVTVVNRMLGRSPDIGVKSKTDVKNFYDLFTTNWAYAHIVEATTAHEYTKNDKNIETWTSYVKDTSQPRAHWVLFDGKKYYVDAKTKKIARGKLTIDNIVHIFDSQTGESFTGFQYDGKYKWYYKNGARQKDISNLGLVKGPYYIEVYKPGNYLIVFAKDGSNGYTIPVKAMVVSTGRNTPTGTYYTPQKFRWLRMEGYTWSQWCTQIQGNYLFHSVPNWTKNNFDLEVDEYNLLGVTRSLGCIRLSSGDAKWLYDNCQLGTQVYIAPSISSGPLPKPASLKLPSWHTWDPTDPTAYYKCKEKKCH